MRLGRPLAAASAVAAMTGASLIASPALANDSNRNSTSSPTSSSSPSPSENAPSPSSSSESHSSSSFRITQEKTFVSASTNSSFTVSGTGCTGQAATDGSWSTDLDLAALIKSIGSSTATTTDGWTIGAGCMTYGGKTETVQTTTQQQTQIFFDDTRISGSYEVSARTETQSQTFTFNAQGFYAGETVTVLLKHKSDSSIRYTLGELTVDANGNLVGNLPAPTDAADGEYLLVLTGSHHGETATSKTITTVSNHTFTIKNSERSTSERETTENNGGGGETQTNGGGEDKTTTDQKVNNQTNRSKSVSSGTKESSSDTRAAGETNTNNGKSLAHTGANGLIFGGIAALLVAIGGAVLFLRRRNKA